MVERRREAAAATTAAEDCDAAGLAAAAMGALAAADLAAVDPTLPTERQEREAAILKRRRREMVREGVRKREDFLRGKKVDESKRFRRLLFRHYSMLAAAAEEGRESLHLSLFFLCLHSHFRCPPS